MNALGIPPSEAERLSLGEFSALIYHNNIRNNPEADRPEITEEDWDWLDAGSVH